MSDWAMTEEVVLQVQTAPDADFFFQEPQCPIPIVHPLHLGCATKPASVLSMLADLNFLHHFPEGGAKMDAVLPMIPTFLVPFAILS